MQNGRPISIDSMNRGVACLVGLECILEIIRSLIMGSCFSSETRSPLPGSPMEVTKRKGSKSRQRSRNPSFGRDEQLRKTPGRMFLHGSSDVASLFTQQAKKGTNQDAMLVWENFGSRTDTVFCGVFDGHGPYGHLVAKRVIDSLPLKLSTAMVPMGPFGCKAGYRFSSFETECKLGS